MTTRNIALAIKEAYPNMTKGALMEKAGFSKTDKEAGRAFSLAIWTYNNKNGTTGGYSLAS